MSDDQRVEKPSTSDGNPDEDKTPEENLREENSNEIHEFFRQNKHFFDFGSDEDIPTLRKVENKDEEIYVYMTIPPDGGWGWVIVAISFLCNAIVDGICVTYGRLIPALRSDLNLDISQAIIISSVMNGVYFLVGPVVSAIVNKVGFRVVAMAGGLVSALGILAGSYAPNLIALVFCYGFITGWGFGMVFSPATIVVGYYFEKYRALATGIAICGSGFGTLIFSPIYDHITQRCGWRGTLRIQAILCLFVTVISFLFRPVKPVRVAKISDDRVETDSSSDASDDASEQSVELDFASYSKFFPTRRATVLGEDGLPLGSDSSRSLPMAPATPPVPIKQQMRKYDPQRHTDNLEGWFKRFWTEITCCKRKPRRTKTLQEMGRRNVNLVIESRPLFRRDIFYAGSLSELPAYQEPVETGVSLMQPLPEMEDQARSINYNMSVMHPPIRSRRKVRHCHISPIIIQGLTLLFDIRLFSYETFRLLLFSCFFYVVGSNIPFLFVTSRADANKIPSQYTNWLVSLIGVSNTVFRLLAGLISFVPELDPTYVSAASVIFGGFFTFLSGFVGQSSLIFQYTFCVVFGQSSALFNTLKQVIFVRCLGLDKLTNAFGITSLIMGIATLVGVPIAGILTDATHNTNATFMYGGISLMLAGILQALVPMSLRRQKEQEARAAKDAMEAAAAKKAEAKRQKRHARDK